MTKREFLDDITRSNDRLYKLTEQYLGPLSGKNAGKRVYMICDKEKMLILFLIANKHLIDYPIPGKRRKIFFFNKINEAIMWLREN